MVSKRLWTWFSVLALITLLVGACAAPAAAPAGGGTAATGEADRKSVV